MALQDFDSNGNPVATKPAKKYLQEFDSNGNPIGNTDNDPDSIDLGDINTYAKRTADRVKQEQATINQFKAGKDKNVVQYNPNNPLQDADLLRTLASFSNEPEKRADYLSRNLGDRFDFKVLPSTNDVLWSPKGKNKWSSVNGTWYKHPVNLAESQAGNLPEFVGGGLGAALGNAPGAGLGTALGNVVKQGVGAAFGVDRDTDNLGQRLAEVGIAGVLGAAGEKAGQLVGKGLVQGLKGLSPKAVTPALSPSQLGSSVAGKPGEMLGGVAESLNNKLLGGTSFSKGLKNQNEKAIQEILSSSDKNLFPKPLVDASTENFAPVDASQMDLRDNLKDIILKSYDTKKGKLSSQYEDVKGGLSDIIANQPKPIETSILDAKGEPQKLFHGTQTAFDKLDPAKLDDKAMYGKGFYFTDSPEVAGTYTEKTPLDGNRNPIENFKLHDDSNMQENIIKLAKKIYGNKELSDRSRENFQSDIININWKDPNEVSTLLKKIHYNGIDVSDLASRDTAPNVRPAFLSVKNAFDTTKPATDYLENLKNYPAENPPANLKKWIDKAMKEDSSIGSLDGLQAYLDNTEQAVKFAEKNGIEDWKEVTAPYEDYIQKKALLNIYNDVKEGNIVTGQDLYKEIDRNLANWNDHPEAQTKIMKKLGFDGIKYDGGATSGGTPHNAYVAFDSEQVVPGAGRKPRLAGTPDPMQVDVKPLIQQLQEYKESGILNDETRSKIDQLSKYLDKNFNQPDKPRNATDLIKFKQGDDYDNALGSDSRQTLRQLKKPKELIDSFINQNISTVNSDLSKTYQATNNDWSKMLKTLKPMVNEVNKGKSLSNNRLGQKITQEETLFLDNLIKNPNDPALAQIAPARARLLAAKLLERVSPKAKPNYAPLSHAVNSERYDYLLKLLETPNPSYESPKVGLENLQTLRELASNPDVTHASTPSSYPGNGILDLLNPLTMLKAVGRAGNHVIPFSQMAYNPMGSIGRGIGLGLEPSIDRGENYAGSLYKKLSSKKKGK